MDYYFAVSGSKENIFINNYSERKIIGGANWEHGFSLSGDDPGDTEYNLVENQISIGMGKGFALGRAGNALQYFEKL